MRNDIHKSTLPLILVTPRPAEYGFRIKHVVTHDPQTAGPLRHQHLTARQPGKRPGVVQSLRQGDHPEVMAGRLVDARRKSVRSVVCGPGRPATAPGRRPSAQRPGRKSAYEGKGNSTPSGRTSIAEYVSSESITAGGVIGVQETPFCSPERRTAFCATRFADVRLPWFPGAFLRGIETGRSPVWLSRTHGNRTRSSPLWLTISLACSRIRSRRFRMARI